jgi:hypothetical protein
MGTWDTYKVAIVSHAKYSYQRQNLLPMILLNDYLPRTLIALPPSNDTYILLFLLEQEAYLMLDAFFINRNIRVC